MSTAKDQRARLRAIMCRQLRDLINEWDGLADEEVLALLRQARDKFEAGT